MHHSRIVKRTGDGALVEFRSVIDAVRCAVELQNGMVERNAGVPEEHRIDFRIGVHLGYYGGTLLNPSSQLSKQPSRALSAPAEAGAEAERYGVA